MQPAHGTGRPARGTRRAGTCPTNDPTCTPLLDGAPRALVLRQDPFHTTIFGHELTLPEIAFYHPAMRIREPERVTADLKRGVEAKADLESVDGSNMTMIMLAKYPADGAPPRPWGLRGIPDPKPFVEKSPLVAKD